MPREEHDHGYRMGRFDLAEQAFIRKNATEMSIEDIAKELNRNVETVKKWIYKEDLLSEKDLSPHMSREILTQKLHNKPYWKELQLQFSETELIYFIESYIDYYIQFKGDVTASEDYSIRQVIAIDILTSRSLRERQKHMKEIDRLDKAIKVEYDKPLADRDRELLVHLQEQLSFARSAISSFTKEHTTLIKESQNFLKQLKATRDQRIDRVESATTSFEGLIRMLHDEKFRRKISQEAEVMKTAKDSAMEQLFEYHTYCDKKVDNPILTAETVKKNKEGQKSKQDKSIKTNIEMERLMEQL